MDFRYGRVCRANAIVKAAGNDSKSFSGRKN